MIGRTWDRACLAVSGVLLAVLLAGGCRDASAPSPDPVEELAGATEVASVAIQLAASSCPLLPPEEAEACASTAEGLGDLVAVADAVLQARSECATGDRDCAIAVGELARERLPELRRVLLRLLALAGRAPR